MNVDAVQRYARQIALPQVGPDGQARFCAARVAVVGADLTAETADRYLAAAGVTRLRLIGGAGGEAGASAAAVDLDAALRGSNPDVAVERVPVPATGDGWVLALDGVAAVLRSGFDDDPMLRAAVRRGVPVVAVRGRDEAVELVSFRRNGPCVHAPLDVPAQASSAPPSSAAAAVVAGTLGAAEILSTLLGDEHAPSARHLSLPLDGRPPRAQEIPWSPACFACGGHGTEMSFS